MAGMNMRRAFNKRMLTRLKRYVVKAGYYDENNDWVSGETKLTYIYGIMTAGNRFSQFDEGIALHSDDGGARYSDFRALYVTNKFALSVKDKICLKGNYYNVLQKADEEEFGFSSYLLEKSEGWAP